MKKIKPFNEKFSILNPFQTLFVYLFNYYKKIIKSVKSNFHHGTKYNKASQYELDYYMK